MPKTFTRYTLLDPNVLDDAYDQIISIKDNAALSVIQISDIPSFAILYSVKVLEASINSLLKAIEEIDGVKKAFMSFEDKIIIIHQLNSKISFCKDVAKAFLNIKKHAIDESPSLALKYKCGTSKINSLKLITREIIENSYLNALAAASRVGLYDSNNHIFHDDYDTTLPNFTQSRKLVADLQDAICENRFILGFQPVFDSLTNQVAWYEVLLRLIDKDGNIITSGPNIAAAERVGFMQFLDETILNLAILELQKDPDISLSVNISASSIDSPIFIESARDLLKNKDLSSRLIIEITETIAPLGIDHFKTSVSALRETGLTIALDDFGAGNTSIKQLSELEPDIIKIDGSIIKAISNGKSNIFLDLAVQYSKEYNAKTVAECIENELILNRVRQLKIDYLQGNYLGEVKLKYK